MIFLLAAAVALGASNTAVVAYIDGISPARPGQVTVVHNGRRAELSGGAVDLFAGDVVAVSDPQVVVRVRYLADNQVISVRQGERYVVGTAALQGLSGSPLTWFERQLTMWGSGPRRDTLAASRGVPGVTCFNASGRSNEPERFDIPVFAAPESHIGTGRRSLFVSWRGGAPPFRVVVSDAATGAVLGEVSDVSATCSTRLPEIDIREHRYKIQVLDSTGVSEEEDSLFGTSHPPTLPAELKQADLSDEARSLYFATWLAVVDGGQWAFEAQQQVRQLDCRSPAVRSWLERWGDAGPCPQ